MPFINIKVLKGTLSKEKKDEMIKRVSETVAEIEASPAPNDNLLAYTWCILEEVEYNTAETRLEPKDTLVIFTDGVTDVQNSDGEMFERDRFLSLLDKPVKSPQSLVDHITSNVFAFIGETPQYDDITLLVVRRKS